MTSRRATPRSRSSPRPSPGGGLRGRLVAAWQAMSRAPPGDRRGCSSSTTTSCRSTSSGREPGTTIIQTWHACGAFKKVGYSVLDKSFGVDEALARRVRIHSNYDVCLVARRRPRRTTPRRSASRSSVRVDAGHPADGRLFGEERLARHPRPSAAATAWPTDKRVILYAPTFRGDSVTDARATDDLDSTACTTARRRPRPARPAPPVRPVRTGSARSSTASRSTCPTIPTSTS